MLFIWRIKDTGPAGRRHFAHCRIGSDDVCNEYTWSRSKRLFDIIVASFMLILTIPLLVAVSVLIACTSGGPVIYRQSRHGLGKRTFSIYKFRTMYHVPNDASFRQATRNDSRVTPVGRLLRRTSIDEIPQLLNVLRGEMSIVGPRPHPLLLDQQYGNQITGYDKRFCARPGITGLAQVRGARGETPTVHHMMRRVEFDLTYINEASLTGDMKILFGTARELMVSRTAF